MGLEKEFVPYELAAKLKELGFYETCLVYYVDSHLTHFANVETGDNTVKAPLWQQAFDWFRINKNIPNWIAKSDGKEWFYKISLGNYWVGSEIKDKYTYEQARQACLEKLIELISKK